MESQPGRTREVFGGVQLPSLRLELEALEAAEPPAPLEMTDDVDALIQDAARNIERVISGATHPEAPRVREMVRGMIERITISRHESGAIEVAVRGAFAGVMQAAGLVERHALTTKKAPGAFASGASLSVVAGAGFEPAAFRL